MRLRATRVDSRLSSVVDAAELPALSRHATIVDVPAGAVLFEQGRCRSQLIWLLEGEASVFRNGELVATLRAGDVAGEMAVVGNLPSCTADVVVTEPAVVAVVSPGEWRSVAAAAPRLRASVLAVAAQRLAKRN